MGMFRDVETEEPSLVKEMAESLGSAGAKLEDLLEKAQQALDQVNRWESCLAGVSPEEKEVLIPAFHQTIKEYNALVEQAEHALAWLLIQREACGFRTHKNVHHFYPIPSKKKLYIP
ncbi:MAG: hypothetical protein ACP5M0_03760 [Desulfomonilaceae bacterium]